MVYMFKYLIYTEAITAWLWKESVIHLFTMTLTPFFKWLVAFVNKTLKLNPDIMANTVFYFTSVSLLKTVNRIKTLCRIFLLLCRSLPFCSMIILRSFFQQSLIKCNSHASRHSWILIFIFLNELIKYYAECRKNKGLI